MWLQPGCLALHDLSDCFLMSSTTKITSLDVIIACSSLYNAEEEIHGLLNVLLMKLLSDLLSLNACSV
jgi:hypothetical protein